VTCIHLLLSVYIEFHNFNTAFSDTMLGLKIMWVMTAGPNLKFCAGMLLDGLRKHTGVRNARITAEN
jgi:hypothetical protein